MQDAGGVGALLPIGIDMRHDIVPHFLFARGGDFVVDVQGKVTQRLELCFGDRKPQFLFGFRKGNPELAPGAELGLF